MLWKLNTFSTTHLLNQASSFVTKIHEMSMSLLSTKIKSKVINGNDKRFYIFQKKKK